MLDATVYQRSGIYNWVNTRSMDRASNGKRYAGGGYTKTSGAACRREFREFPRYSQRPPYYRITYGTENLDQAMLQSARLLHVTDSPGPHNHTMGRYGESRNRIITLLAEVRTNWAQKRGPNDIYSAYTYIAQCAITVTGNYKPGQLGTPKHTGM